MHPSPLLPVRRGFALLLATFIAGCSVGPKYQRPDANPPTAFHTAASAPAAAPGTNSLAQLGWWEVLADAQLQRYLAEALTNSWDIKLAVARVLEAEAAAQAVRSHLMPTVGAGADWTTSRASERGPATIPPGVNPEKEYGSVYGAMATYEVDLWGRLRKANEAARARLLATRDAERVVRQTLVSQVATAYLTLLALDYEYAIAQKSYGTRTKSLVLTETREKGGVAALQDVAQARILVYSAESSMINIIRLRELQENALALLLGRNPGPIERGEPFLQQRLREDIPAGLPSTLLEQRPDIAQAEQLLIAANADIGQAKAAFFPQLTLTGFAGVQSVALSDLFTSPAKAWQFGPTVSLPLFTGGRLRANLKSAQAQYTEALVTYQRTVQQAFREVSDSLIGYQRYREFAVSQDKRTQANRLATDLANTRYEGGVTSYLEVLYNEQELLSAELNLAQARLNELLSVVQLYRALGGGWQSPATATVTSR